MPVVRSRNANVRFEAGRGYPRFNKWSDINKSTIIADDVHLEKREFELLSHAPNFSRCELRAESKKHSSSSEWNLRRHGVLIQSDGESDEASSDNSLICSNLKVIPDNGKVRMALTVPLTRLAAPETRNRSVLQSTLQIKHTTRHIAKDGRASNEQKLYSCSGNAERNFSRQKKKSSSTKGHYKPSEERIFTNNDFNEVELKNKKYHDEEAISSPPFGFRDSHIFICENKESLRPLSFWHDMRACRNGCIASQKNRLRDGTFIISPTDSDTNLARKKRGLKMLPRNSLFPGESEEFHLPANRSMKGVFPLRLGLNGATIPSDYDNYEKRRRDGYLKSLSRKPPIEVRVHYQGMRHYPITFTSASHTGLRCYPPLECHPSPKCRQSFPKPFELPNLNRCRRFPVVDVLPTHSNLILKKKPFDNIGLTIRNRYAVMDSDSDENEQFPRYSIQKPYSRVMSENYMGQKASSGDGSTKLPKRQANSQQSNSPGSSSATPTIETPTNAPSIPEAGNSTPSKGKKVLKTSVKETSTKKTFHLKAKCSSNSLPSCSPASLHGRVLQKTSTVTPAPSKATGANSQSLPRFGFKNSSLINSGDSTDSVNSILSDAQTTSDANSNLFDFGEENGNAPTDRTDKLTPIWKSEGTPTLNVRSASPCTISQASSGVTSSLLNGKFKAHTKQLPSPQTVTVKEMNNNKKKQISPNGSYKLRNASPSLKKTQTPQSSPAVSSKDHRSKIPQNIKASLSKTQKASKEIESSNRSISTIDSGLGSSLESDKLRSPKILSPNENDKLIDTGQGIVNNVGDIHLDLSDEWLKEKHTHLSLGSNVIGDSNLINGSVTQKPGKIQKDIFKEKRDSNITYGMARQKFAPYSRYRFNYQNNIKSQNQTDKNVSKTDILSQSKSNLPGVVRSRIAQLEKTPSKTPTNLSSHKAPKKSVTKPTSIEKTPILVNPKIENNIELSRSICKRLEYNEGKKSSLLENISDNKLERRDEAPTIIRDLLMVDSVEVKKKSFDSDEGRTSPSKGLVNISDNKIKVNNSEQKRIRDIAECENTIKRLSDESKLNTDLLHLPLPDNSAKIFSPDGSETSFEVLESGSVDCSPREEVALSASNEAYLNHLVAGLAKSSSDSITSSKPFQNLPDDTHLKNSEKNCSNEEPTSNPEECVSQADTCTVVNEERQDNFEDRSKSVMESSVESSRSESNRTTDNNGDRWTTSGKCTPSIGSTRGDADQDFLIDDEISDQPGLTFGDDLDASLFGDEDLFSDLSSASAANILSKKERSRHGSIGTTASSLGPDDLMLDYDLEESKPYGPKQNLKSSDKSPNTTAESKNSSQQCKSKKVEISLPGRRYDEEVLSPVACDILSEWSAILSGTQSPIRSSPEPCVSQQTAVVNTVCSSALSSASSQTQTTNVVTTLQPLREENSFSPEGCSSSRSRAFSVGAEVPLIEGKKGLNLKPPRQGLPSEHDGGLNIDRTTLHYLCQDVTAMKTLLLRLRRVLQVTDTINPFDANLKTSLYLNLGVNDANEKDEPTSVSDVVQQNVDLKRQVILLQQRLDEKDRTIRSLQQQLMQPMQKSTSSSVVTPTNSSSGLVSSFLSCGDDDLSNCSSSEKSLSNAATQTERNSHRSSSMALASISRTSSVEDGFGPTVSFENLTAERSPSENSVILNENSVEQKEEKKEEEKEEVVESLSSHKNYPTEIIPAGSPKLSLVSTTTNVTGPLAPS